MTSDERRVKNLTPRMRAWVEKLQAGYTVRPVIRGSSFRRTDWRGGLFNPNGDFVQVLRRDTVAKLLEMGVIGQEKEKQDDHSGTDAPERGD